MKKINYRNLFWGAIIFSVFLYLLLCSFLIKPDSDLKFYFNYATKIISNKEVPYKDFYVVYPPLSLLVFIIPALFTKNFYTYSILFGIEMVIFLGILIYLIFLISKNLKKDYRLPILFALSLTMCLGYIITKRYDIFVSFLTIISIYLLLKDKYTFSALFLSLGILAKLYPIIFFPLYFLYIYKRKNKKEAIIFSVYFMLFLIITLMPLFIIVPPKSAGFYSFLYHFTRPLHCESLYGGLLLLLEKTKLPVLKAPLKNDIYGWSIYSPLSPILLPLSTVLILLFFSFILINFWKEKKVSKDIFLKYIFLFLLVFIVFNKVLSPQYLIWLLPLAVLVFDIKNFKIFFLISILTLIIYPFSYTSLIKKELWIVLLLILRNFLLLYLFLYFGFSLFLKKLITKKIK